MITSLKNRPSGQKWSTRLSDSEDPHACLVTSPATLESFNLSERVLDEAKGVIDDDSHIVQQLEEITKEAKTYSQRITGTECVQLTSTRYNLRLQTILPSGAWPKFSLT